MANGNSSVIGHLDGIDGDGHARGWAYDRAKPGAAIEVELVLNDVVVGTALAQLERPDLIAAKIGSGRHGFRIPVALEGPVGELNVLKARVVGSTQELASAAVLTSEDICRIAAVELPLDDFPSVQSVVRHRDGSRRIQFDAGEFNEFRRRFLLI